MKYIIILFVVVCLAYGDTTWEFPFTELGANWDSAVFQLWPTGLHYYCFIGVTTPWSVLGYADSGLLTFPTNVDSITIEMQSEWLYYGTLIDAGASADLRITALTPDSNLIYTKYLGFYESDGYLNESDSLYISQTIVLPNNTLELNFFCYQAAGGDFWSVHFQWDPHDVLIIGHESSSLSRITWGAIKNSFE